ncbi:MAG TPA: MFS transporter [Jiangellaceae bacterium]|nr:MFS transporter [Jiangellaceae bacterium]
MEVTPDRSGSRLSQWWAGTSAGLPESFWYLLAGAFVNRLGYMVEPFLALYLSGPRSFGASTVGVVLAAFGAGAFASQPIGGYLADRFGRRSTLVGGMIGSAASFMLLASVRDLALIAVAACLSGLTIDLYRPAVSAMIADLVAPENRAKAFALLYWAINLGVAVAGVTGGLLAARSYWLLFIVDAATCLAFAVLIARKVPETRPARQAGEQGGYRQAVRDGLLLTLAAAILLGTIVYLQSFVTLPLAVAADGLGPEAYGLIYAVNPIVVIIAQIGVLRVIDRLPGVPTLAISAVIMGVGFGLTAVASSVPFYMLTVVVWTLGEIGFNAVGPAMVADIAPAHLRGRYNGVIGMSFGAAALVAPLVGTQVFENYGETALWTGCLVLSIVSAAVTLAMGPAVKRRMTTLSEAKLAENG